MISSLRKYYPALIKLFTKLNPELATRMAITLFLTPFRYSRTESENKFWQTGKPVLFKSGNHGRIFGSGSRTVWFIHGWESRASKFQVLINACVDAGYQVVAWDSPAHGDSPGNRTNMVAVTQAFLIDSAAFSSEPLHALIGHSFGADVAANACRLGVKTKKLVMISAAAVIRDVFVRFWKAIDLDDKLKLAFIKQTELETKSTLTQISPENFIHSLNQQVLIIHDKNDKEVPFAEAELLKARWPAVELVATEKLGHRRILESPDVASILIKFLSEN